jgi:hypothetical protein
MQLSSEAGPPPATRSDNIDDAYEQSFSDPTDEHLNELNQAEGVQKSASVNATSTLSPVADPPQVMQTIPPSVAGHAQADDPIPQKSPPTKSRQRRASPPVKLTPTRLRPRITPSKFSDSSVAEKANARRTQPPKSPSPSPPIPSQICAMSIASSAPLAPNTSFAPNPSSMKIVITDDDPFLNTNAAPRPQLNHGSYPYGNQYRPPQQMVSPYAYPPQGFPPMNMPPYGPGHDYHSQFGEASNYGSLAGVQHGLPLLGPGYPHPAHFQQSSGYPYFNAPVESSYPASSRESTAAPRDVMPSLASAETNHHFVTPSGPSLPLPVNTAPISTSEGTEKLLGPAKISERQHSSNGLPKGTQIAPLAAAASDDVLVLGVPEPERPVLNPPASTVAPAASEGLNAPVPGILESGAISAGSLPPDKRPRTKIFDNVTFTPLHLPPGPNDPPIVKISPPTPIPPITPKRPSVPPVSVQSANPAGIDLSTDYHTLVDNGSPTLGRLSKSKQEVLITGFEALDKLVKEISVSSGLSVLQIVERWNGGTPRSLNSWNIYQAFIKKHLVREIGRLISIKKTKSSSQDFGPFSSFTDGLSEAPSDEIDALQTTLDEGGNFSSKVISDAYDGFQAAFPDNADKLLRAWAQVNIMDSEKSVGQRAGNFKKQSEQFRTLVGYIFWRPRAFII